MRFEQVQRFILAKKIWGVRGTLRALLRWRIVNLPLEVTIQAKNDGLPSLPMGWALKII